MKDVIFMWVITILYMGGLTLVLAVQNDNSTRKIIAAIEDNGHASVLEIESKQRTNQSTYTYDNL